MNDKTTYYQRNREKNIKSSKRYYEKKKNIERASKKQIYRMI